MYDPDSVPDTRIVFGEGALDQLPTLVAELNGRRTLLVADRGIVSTGQVDRAMGLLQSAGILVFGFHDFESNPDARMVETGRAFAAACVVDSIVALGGGSSLDCAKGINFVLTSGGTMRDYWGYGKAPNAMLPMIGIPTTAGTGSEAQSYALISDADNHVKMACGDPKAFFRVAILDPVLTLSQPPPLTATTGFDAISHAVEAFVTSRRNEASDRHAREAWCLLDGHFEEVLRDPANLRARGAMLLGAHRAGLAIEQSMLGATHACANPLTARYGTTHGIAIAVMLPHVVRWNATVVGDRYGELLTAAGRPPSAPPAEELAEHLGALARAGGLPATLRELGVVRADMPLLAQEAAKQWTGTFNPRPFDAKAALQLYEQAYGSGPLRSS